MSSTLEQRTLTVGGLRLGAGPAVVIEGWVSLREHHGRVPAASALTGAAGPLFVEPFSTADLPAIAERADGVVIGAAWMQDFQLVRAAARLGLPVIVQRGPAATLEEWLGVADYCVAEGNDQVVFCESGTRQVTLDLSLLRAARSRSGRPVLADLSRDASLAAAAVAAGADGLLLAPTATATEVAAAREAVTLIGALVRPEAPATLPECRGAIDRVDAALATLLERRAALAGVVQSLKPIGGFAGRDPERERQLVATMAERAPDLGEARLAPIMNAVIEAGLHLSEERLSGGR